MTGSKFCRLLDGEVARLRTLQNPIHVARHAMNLLAEVRAVSDKLTGADSSPDQPHGHLGEDGLANLGKPGKPARTRQLGGRSAPPYSNPVVSVRPVVRAGARWAAGESADSESTPICRA
jgi:hypothetical protein